MKLTMDIAELGDAIMAVGNLADRLESQDAERSKRVRAVALRWAKEAETQGYICRPRKGWTTQQTDEVHE